MGGGESVWITIRLSEKTIKDAYPMPHIEESLDALGGSIWFSSLDLIVKVKFNGEKKLAKNTIICLLIMH